eukprot:CAMPEP_0195285258 /NCGR_PEP_ID=MMETSP0707-20130614/3161_1 /TAXON_ID=33640 /ORGANISM="Asterionellopsis glacialis, Strain CCMP134" /LENGTH=383 /DNA_ID=CAMNT_0040344729 /DNA_START=67 /DNA_END=1218 /DNA_ORIENTATION=-
MPSVTSLSRFAVIRIFFVLALPSVMAVPVGIWGGTPYTEECMDTDDGSCTVLPDLTADFGFTVVMTRMKARYLANTFLPHIEEKGWKAVIGFSSQWTPDDDADGCDGDGDDDEFTEGSATGVGRFTLDAFIKDLREDRFYDDEDETYAGYVETINEYVASGTLIAVMMADDVMNYGNFGWDRCDPKPIALNAMGAELKSMFPDLPVWIRLDPTDLKERYDDTTYFVPHNPTCMRRPSCRRPSNIDAVVAQYLYNVDDPQTARNYAIEQKAAADALGLDIVCGLNIANGGDGSSGQIGHYGVNDAGSTIYAMSPDEISSYGKQLIRNTGCDTMLLWEFDGDEEWYDGTIGGEYFQSDEDYLDSTHDLVDCDHGLFGCPGRFGPF